MHSLLSLTTPFALVSFYSTPFELKHALTLAKVTRLFVHPNVLAKVLPVARELGLANDRIHTIGGSPVKGRKSFGDMVRHARVKKMKRLAVRKASRDTLACEFIRLRGLLIARLMHWHSQIWCSRVERAGCRRV